MTRLRVAASSIVCLFIVLVAFAKESTRDSIVYDKGTSWSTITPSATIVCFAFRGSEVWYATDKALCLFDSRKKDYKDSKQISGAPQEGISCIAVDKNGTVWVGTANGLYKGTDKGFNRITTDQGIPSMNINSIAISFDGAVWIATDEGVGRYFNGVWTTYNTSKGLCSNNVLDVLWDGESTIWAGTDKGVCSFKGGIWTCFNSKNGLSGNKVSVLGWDPRREELWAVVDDKNVASYDGKNWNNFLDAVEDVSDIMVDSQSRIWFGSPSKGLVKFNGEDWVSDPQQLGIAAAEVRQMYRDEGGNLYFGSEKGLIRMVNPYPF